MRAQKAWTTESAPAHLSPSLSPPCSTCPPLPSTVHEQQSAVKDEGIRGGGRKVLTFFPPAGQSPFSPRGILLLSDSAACTPAWIPRSHDKAAEASHTQKREISPFPCCRINYPRDLLREIKDLNKCKDILCSWTGVSNNVWIIHPGTPQHSMLSLQGAQVQSLAQELRSPMPRATKPTSRNERPHKL